MKERPILFSGEMVRAILDGRKTQTRRVIKPQPGSLLQWQTEGPYQGFWMSSSPEPYPLFNCPYGISGDRLWVKETFNLDGSLFYRADGEMTETDLETVFKTKAEWKWRPAIFMPRVFSRITLEVVSVRVERVQEISRSDALAEGLSQDGALNNYGTGSIEVDAFAELWDSINEKRGYSWAKNPWVWMVEFKVLTPQASPSPQIEDHDLGGLNG